MKDRSNVRSKHGRFVDSATEKISRTATSSVGSCAGIQGAVQLAERLLTVPPKLNAVRTKRPSNLGHKDLRPKL